MAGYIGSQPVPQATQTRSNFTATAGQTTFTTRGYTPNYVDVYLNGAHLDPVDYIAIDGYDIILNEPAVVDDVLTVVGYKTFEVGDDTTFSVYEYTATDGQTSFTGLDDNGLALSYTAGKIIVSYDGFDLPQSDFSGTDGTTVTLADGAVEGKIVRIKAYNTFTVADVMPSSGGSFGGNVTFNENAVVDGNLLVGQDTVDNSETGISLAASGKIQITRENNTPFLVNRKNGNGIVVDIRKDQFYRGGIGVYDDAIDIGNGASGGTLRFRSSTNAIYPVTGLGGSNSNGTTALGRSDSRFSNLYLSGGVYLGGTGSANHLDDYEEGSWSVGLSGHNVTAIDSTVHGTYVKIGNIVHLNGTLTTVTASAGLRYVVLATAPFVQDTNTTQWIGHCAPYPNGDRQAGLVINNSSVNNTQWWIGWNQITTATQSIRFQITYKSNT